VSNIHPIHVVAAALLVGTGCNSAQLRYTTLRLTSTLPDLQQKQVLDNFARIASDPGALPYFAVVNAGSANVNDSGSGSLSFMGAPEVYTQRTHVLSAERTVTGNWTLVPLNNPDRLAAMRAAYLMVLQPSAVDPADFARLRDVLLPTGADPNAAVPRGWLCVGHKRDVPKDACFVAHEGGTYVWVMPGHTREFSNFVLTILNLATVWPADAAPRAPAALPPPGARVVPPPAFAPRLYEGTPDINRGLFFIPRS
jgi:hypothetical protein